MKIPEPTTVPMTTAMAVLRPSSRRSSVSVPNASDVFTRRTIKLFEPLWSSDGKAVEGSL
jgi:hypothetical protein